MIPQEQLSFLSDKNNFLLKNEVDTTVNKLLYSFQNSIFDLLDKEQYALPAKLSKLPGKVTKGNNLKGFPFQVSDYPSTFNKEDIFSFRSIVWYGHFFSFSLILSGVPKENHIVDLEKITNKGYKLVTNEAIWETDLINEGSIDISTGELKAISALIKKSSGFKIFKAYELNQFYDFERLGIECFNEFFSTN